MNIQKLFFGDINSTHDKFLQISFQDSTTTFEFVFKHDSFVISLIIKVNIGMNDKNFIFS
jgi:hypothetical protein